MRNTVRAELLKLRTMPGAWVCFGLAFPLTFLVMWGTFARAGGGTGHTYSFVHTLALQRVLLGAGYLGLTFLAPVAGVICITSEYRHKTITNTLLYTPVRSRVLGAKIVVTAYWCILMALLTIVTVVAIGLPWNSGLGGTVSSVTDQFGAVFPGLFAATILLGLFGLGFGVLVKNQIAGILLTIGGTFILEPILIGLFKGIFNYNLNWLPTRAASALAGAVAGSGFGGGGGGGGNGVGGQPLLPWWQGGLVMLAWGLVPLTLGYFTTFRRDVT
jgi:ABC-type transport system involved in multi-copper enzyme maturation permease subunit